MFFGYIEKELLGIEIDPTNQTTTLPESLQLQINKGQGKQDIWECQCEEIQAAIKKQSEKKLK
ncbi:hypothetical protein [Nostoc sp. MS1]|uniref:hypothetical protein n=1 Tax=Nostoc sp. MS1 TaxID=2764711 RepID=UPI001CC675B1|nr:hypothetical protein [Nostoc sp. MS1]BCL36014.1 hypothetical protein NSMS1_24610 [Nostoc sp. MS1]